MRRAARVALERPAGGFEGFEGGQTAVLNALKSRWLGPVAARVAVERLAEGFEALSGACSCRSCLGNACGKLQELPWKGLWEGLRGLARKNRWLGPVAV